MELKARLLPGREIPERLRRDCETLGLLMRPTQKPMWNNRSVRPAELCVIQQFAPRSLIGLLQLRSGGRVFSSSRGEAPLSDAVNPPQLGRS